MVYSHMPIAYAIYRDRDGRATWGRLVKLFRVVTSEATVRCATLKTRMSAAQNIA